jgi:Amt family ammonium transporter
LIVGAFPERVRFPFVLLFSALWLILVYLPVAHVVWGGGWAARAHVLDFAGGIVVHTTAGVSALMAAILIGPRAGFPHHLIPPHSPGMTMAGAGMLWVGWFGFNGGSALAADASAGYAVMATHLAAAAAAMTGMAIEWWRIGKPTSIGLVTGAVAGLATITPASGYVGPMGAVVLGAIGGTVCFFATNLIKQRFRIDDTLDVFAVHGVGGMGVDPGRGAGEAGAGRRWLCRGHGHGAPIAGSDRDRRRRGAMVDRRDIRAGQADRRRHAAARQPRTGDRGPRCRHPWRTGL